MRSVPLTGCPRPASRTNPRGIREAIVVRRTFYGLFHLLVNEFSDVSFCLDIFFRRERTFAAKSRS